MTNQIPSWARVGAKVVCVSGSIDPDMVARIKRYPHEISPEIGKVYTIRKVGENGGLLLNEIKNKEDIYLNEFGESCFREASFWVHRFRPVQTRTLEQDVAIFAPLLETKSEKELVDG